MCYLKFEKQEDVLYSTWSATKERFNDEEALGNVLRLKTVHVCIPLKIISPF